MTNPQIITVNGHTVRVATNVEFRPANVGTKSITNNGTYKASDDSLDGYSQVTVNVSGGGGSTLGTKTVNANGTYKASDDSLDGYSQVTVAVPASAVDTGTKSITANGNNQDVVGYAAVNVNVPNSYSAGDEGKVVDNGALVAQTAHSDVTPTTSDQTIDTTMNNSIKVKGDANLLAGNIKKDVTIFNTTGSYEGGGSPDITYENSTGILYSTNMIIDSSVRDMYFQKLKGATNLKSVLHQRTDPYGPSYNINAALQGCMSLEYVTLLNGVGTGGYCEDIIKNCPNIKSFTLGGIGYPNNVGVGPTSGSYLMFRSITVAFDIIIYANAASLADVPSTLKTGSPWGATNATVIYKSSVTGEVLT